MSNQKTLLVVFSFLIFTACQSTTYRNVIQTNSPLVAVYAHDRVICQKDSTGNFTTACIKKAVHMASFPCFDDEDQGRSTAKGETDACKCNHHIDTEKSCAVWIESGK